MRMSEKGIGKLIEWEGVRHKVYRDSAGLPTIGVGHLLKKDEIRSGKININGKPVKYADGLTDEQVHQLLRRDLISREAAVSQLVRVPLTQPQFDTLVSFVFNIGRYAFQDSKLLKVLNDGKYKDVPAQLARWVYAAGEKVEGLINRREKEIAMWDSARSINIVSSPTLEWLIKKNGINLPIKHNGKDAWVEYDPALQQFIIKEVG